jgi:hypothetical protein
LVSVLQVVGTHSEQGAAALQAVDGTAWLELDLSAYSRLNPWCLPESDEQTSGHDAEKQGSNYFEEPFWKEEEDALKELLTTGRSRWVEAGDVENQRPAGTEMSEAHAAVSDAESLGGFQRLMDDDDTELEIRRGEQEHSPQDDIDQEQAEQAERAMVASAIDDWENMAVKPRQPKPTNDADPLKPRPIEWDRRDATRQQQQRPDQDQEHGLRHERKQTSSLRHGDSSRSTPELPASSPHAEQLVEQLQGKWIDGDGARISVSGRTVEIFRSDSQTLGAAGELQNGTTSHWYIEFVERSPDEQEEDLGSGVFHGTITLWFGGSRLLLPHDPAHPKWRLDSSQQIRVWQQAHASTQQQNDSAEMPAGNVSGTKNGQYDRMLPPPPPPSMAMPMPMPTPMPMPMPQSPRGSGSGRTQMRGMPPPAWPANRPDARVPLGTTAVSAHEIALLTTRLRESFGTAGIETETGVDIESLIDAIGDASRAMHALRAAIDLSVGIPDKSAFGRQLRHLRALLT